MCAVAVWELCSRGWWLPHCSVGVTPQDLPGTLLWCAEQRVAPPHSCCPALWGLLGNQMRSNVSFKMPGAGGARRKAGVGVACCSFWRGLTEVAVGSGVCAVPLLLKQSRAFHECGAVAFPSPCPGVPPALGPVCRAAVEPGSPWCFALWV